MDPLIPQQMPMDPNMPFAFPIPLGTNINPAPEPEGVPNIGAENLVRTGSPIDNLIRMLGGGAGAQPGVEPSVPQSVPPTPQPMPQPMVPGSVPMTPLEANPMQPQGGPMTPPAQSLGASLQQPMPGTAPAFPPSPYAGQATGEQPQVAQAPVEQPTSAPADIRSDAQRGVAGAQAKPVGPTTADKLMAALKGLPKPAEPAVQRPIPQAIPRHGDVKTGGLLNLYQSMLKGGQQPPAAMSLGQLLMRR